MLTQFRDNHASARCHNRSDVQREVLKGRKRWNGSRIIDPLPHAELQIVVGVAFDGGAVRLEWMYNLSKRLIAAAQLPAHEPWKSVREVPVLSFANRCVSPIEYDPAIPKWLTCLDWQNAIVVVSRHVFIEEYGCGNAAIVRVHAVSTPNIQSRGRSRGVCNMMR